MNRLGLGHANVATNHGRQPGENFGAGLGAALVPSLGAGLAVPNGLGFIALLEAFRATGGAVPEEIVARLLQEHQAGNAASLARQLYTGQVFGFSWHGNLWMPMFQFHLEDMTVKASVQQVRARLVLRTGWAVAAWFAAPNARLDGRTPVAMLDVDFEAVMLATRPPAAMDAMNAFESTRVRRVQEAVEHI